jgi:Zn-dependent protease with chaperone function
MMFVLREIAVSLTCFVLLYCCFSIIVAATWRGLACLRSNAKSLAEMLFFARVLPILASVVITCGFVVPSFQLLEPRWTDEGLGRVPVAFGIAAILLIVLGCCRVFSAQTGTARIVAEWLQSSRPVGTDTYTVCSRQNAPPLTLVGLRKPRVLVSDLAVELLTEGEIRIALRHEHVHILSRDNLKKLIFRFCPFPGMGKLEAAWVEAAELAADDGAVSNTNDALDLAAALVKLSRIAPIEVPPVCTVGFVTGAVSLRVSRLLAWEEAKDQDPRLPGWAAVSMVLGATASLLLVYGPALVITHEITELLVR